MKPKKKTWSVISGEGHKFATCYAMVYFVHDCWRKLRLKAKLRSRQWLDLVSLRTADGLLAGFWTRVAGRDATLQPSQKSKQ